MIDFGVWGAMRFSQREEDDDDDDDDVVVVEVDGNEEEGVWRERDKDEGN